MSESEKGVKVIRDDTGEVLASLGPEYMVLGDVEGALILGEMELLASLGLTQEEIDEIRGK